MAFEIVEIRAAGLVLNPVTFSLRLARDEAARTFECKIKHPSLPQPALLAALAGSPSCTIHASGDLVLTGHVEKRDPSIRGDEQELAISGRSKTGDVVDSSHDHKTGEFRQKTAKDVFSELAGDFGVKIEANFTPQPRDLFRLRPGETVFRAAERWARGEGFSISDTENGDLNFTKGTDKRHAGAISDGDTWPPLLDASASHDDSKKFSKVKVKAQAPDGYTPDALQIEGEAADETLGRLRRRVIVPPETVTKTAARDRAKHHRDRAAGNGTTAEVQVKGWRDAAGALWKPGNTVFVEVAGLGLAQDMMIEGATFAQTDATGEGTTTKLSLVDPRAYGGKAGKGNKSGKGWDLGKSGGDDE